MRTSIGSESGSLLREEYGVDHAEKLRVIAQSQRHSKSNRFGY
jgi:hypothetical protein